MPLSRVGKKPIVFPIGKEKPRSFESATHVIAAGVAPRFIIGRGRVFSLYVRKYVRGERLGPIIGTPGVYESATVADS